MIFRGKKDSIMIFKRLILLIVVIGILIGLVYLIMPTVVESFLKRFEEDDISNGRIDLFGYYLDVILNNANVSLFGIGLQNIPEKVETLFGGYFGVPHNGILETVLIWGIPGLVVFLWYVYNMIKPNIRNGNKLSLGNYIPLLLCTLQVQFGQIVTSGIITLTLLIIYLNLTINFNERD